VTRPKRGAETQRRRKPSEHDAAAARQRARDRAGDEALPRKSGPARGGATR